MFILQQVKYNALLRVIGTDANTAPASRSGIASPLVYSRQFQTQLILRIEVQDLSTYTHGTKQAGATLAL